MYLSCFVAILLCQWLDVSLFLLCWWLAVGARVGGPGEVTFTYLHLCAVSSPSPRANSTFICLQALNRHHIATGPGHRARRSSLYPSHARTLRAQATATSSHTPTFAAPSAAAAAAATVTQHTPRAAYRRRFHAGSLSPADAQLASLNIVTRFFPHFLFSLLTLKDAVSPCPDPRKLLCNGRQCRRGAARHSL
jgi:hypothetical protein